MNAHLPPPPAPPTAAQTFMKFLDVIADPKVAREGVRAAILEIEQHKDAVTRLELDREKFRAEMATERTKLEAEWAALAAAKREHAEEAERRQREWDEWNAKKEHYRREMRRIDAEFAKIAAEEAAAA
jgi:hypothetical protein